MKTFLRVVENTTWYRQFVYGAILALVFGFLTITSGFNPFWAIVQLVFIAWVREDYLRDKDSIGGFRLEKQPFNWRNFYFIQVPGLLLYFAWTAAF